MRIREVVRRKGDNVISVRPDDDVAHLLALLVEHGIGAIVVSDDGTTLAGIASERDVVRHLHTDGPAVLEQPVSTIMTELVQTCGLDDELETLARRMTEHRVRHIPVLHEGKLLAIVSIGDIVKNRIDELQDERDQLVDYIQQ
ncbi:MAG TPA: CBS domain-containing protein [Jiangellaceae bacterium]|nr:CBS domain-containing protein [Jiangellaceae bacterium]